MGSINTSIQLYDGASGTLQKITNAVSRITQRFDDMNDHFEGAFDEGSFNSAKNGFNTINILINKIENNIDRSTTTQQAFTQQVNKSTAAENELLSRMQSVENTVNGLGSGIKQANTQQQNLNNSLNAGSAAGGGLLSKVKSIVAAYLGFQAVKNVLNASDELTLTTARLNLMNDGLQTTEQLSQKIFESAERARGSYTDTAAVISKLGIMAGKAFQNNDEIIAFTELMNKNFKVGGASATEQASAMYQLTQAMASGRLQGDEYRSIIENAPLLAKSIEDYMVNVKHAKGTMKDWASEGLLTANVIKAAMFRSGDEVEERFKAIPMTWADIANGIKNNTLVAFQPVLTRINEMANSEKFQVFKTNLITGFQAISMVAMELFNQIINIVNFFSNNWGIIAPIIYGIAGAMALYTAVLIANNTVQAISNGLKVVAALRAGVLATAQAYAAGATFAEMVAVQGLNTALLACPLVWIILLIVALIAIFYAVIGAINKFAGTSLSATGIIAGAFLWLGALIANAVIGTINAIIQFMWTRFVEPIISIVEWVLNVFNGGFDSFGDAVKNLLGQIISWFLSLGKVVTKIIDAIFGTSWTDGLSSLQNDVLGWGKNENSITLDRNAPEISHRFDMTDAYGAGYEWGAGLFNKQEKQNKSKDDNTNDYANMYNNIAATADNTGKIAQGVKISDEDLKYLHDVAEREAINRFTTAEIKVDMTNNNSINGTNDIDGVVNYLRNEVEEAMSRSAEGV